MADHVTLSRPRQICCCAGDPSSAPHLALVLHGFSWARAWRLIPGLYFRNKHHQWQKPLPFSPCFGLKVSGPSLLLNPQQTLAEQVPCPRSLHSSTPPCARIHTVGTSQRFAGPWWSSLLTSSSLHCSPSTSHHALSTSSLLELSSVPWSFPEQQYSCPPPLLFSDVMELTFVKRMQTKCRHS